MRKWTGIWFLIFILLFLPLMAYGQSQPSDAQIYEKGQQCYHRVRADSQLKKDRNEWKRCISMFDVVAEKSNSPYSAKASYSSGRLSRELFANTGSRADLNDALVNYNKVVIDHPRSSLADDSLYQIARIRAYQTKEPERARKALDTLIKRYPNGDSVPAAKEMLASLDGKNTEKSKDADDQRPVPERTAGTYSDSPASAKQPGVLVDVKYEKSRDETETTLFFDRPVAYRITFESGKKGRGSKPSLDVLLKETYARIGLEEKIGVNSSTVKKIKIGPRILGGTKVRFDLQKNTDYSVRESARELNLVFRRAPNYNHKTAYAPAPQHAKAQGEKKGFWSRLKFWHSDEKGPRQLRVVIDPGHGGDEKGAVGPHGITEKDITLDISKRLAQTLERRLGAKVWLTRTRDKNLSLKKRNKIAQKKKADLFISVHANASEDSHHSGIETYYLNNASDEASIRLAKRENDSWRGPTSDIDHVLSTMLQNAITEDSRDLAAKVHSSMIKDVKQRYKGIKDRGVRSALFYVLVGTKAPGILIETSFITNEREEMRLADPTYQEQIASSIADGIKEYISKDSIRYSNL